MTIELLLTGLLAIVLLAFAGVLFRGAPYVPTMKIALAAMLRLTKPRPGESMVDLGAGDGRVVTAFAQHGLRAEGYELNPLLVWVGRRGIRRAEVTRSARIYQRSIWQADCRRADIVVVFGLDRYGFMERLEAKLRAELPIGARVVSNAFRFPDWQPEKMEDGVYLYRQDERV